MLARNFTPSSTAAVSVSVKSGTAVLGQIVHGQPKLLAAVVNVQLTGSIVLPAASRAPLIRAVYVVAVASAAPGVRVTVRVVAL